MSKREKKLLALLVAIGVVGIVVMYLLLPAIKENTAAAQQLEALEMQKAEMETMLAVTGVEEALAEHKALADTNYDYFYSELNSYTIDGIINQLVSKSGLEMLGMSISEYNMVSLSSLDRGQEIPAPEEESSEVSGEEPAASDGDAAAVTDGDAADVTDDAASSDEAEEEEPDEEFLLGSTVQISVRGTYGQVLELVDIFERESTCIEVTSLSLSRDYREVGRVEAVEAQMTLLIYGIKTVEEMEASGEDA